MIFWLFFFIVPFTARSQVAKRLPHLTFMEAKFKPFKQEQLGAQYLVGTKRVNNNGESVEQNWCRHRRILRDKPHKWILPKMNWYILTAMNSASCLNHLERGFVLFHLDLQTMVQVFQNDISRQAQIQDPSLVHGKSYLLNWWNERYIRAFVRGCFLKKQQHAACREPEL